ncbi:MAG: DapH/DapD/GlmU-related protein [Halobacteriota archaeon]|jgi:serine O-acetyltransferase
MTAFGELKGNVISDLNVYNAERYAHKKHSSLLTAFLLIRSTIVHRGFRAMLIYRLGHYAYLTKNRPLLGIALSLKAVLSMIDISFKAEIGSGMHIHHGQGVVIGDSVIGKNVGIWQGVTIGSTWNKEREGRSYPIVGDNVRLSAGAKIIGPVSIGKDVVIGANAVVVEDIPESCVAVGVPAKVVGSSKKLR